MPAPGALSPHLCSVARDKRPHMSLLLPLAGLEAWVDHNFAFYSKTAQGCALVALQGLPWRVEAELAPGRAQDPEDGVRPSVTHKDIEVRAGDVAGEDGCILKTNLNHLNWHVLCLSVQRNRF